MRTLLQAASPSLDCGCSDERLAEWIERVPTLIIDRVQWYSQYSIGKNCYMRDEILPKAVDSPDSTYRFSHELFILKHWCCRKINIIATVTVERA